MPSALILDGRASDGRRSQAPFEIYSASPAVQALLLGYVEFVALLLLPGAAFVELFRVGGDLSLAERLGLAFGLSMAIDVLVLAFRTSGLLVGSQLMVGIFPGTLEIMLAVSFVAFAAAVG